MTSPISPLQVQTSVDVKLKSPEAVKSTLNGFPMFRFFLYASGIVLLSVAWVLIDIYLTFVHPFDDPDQNGLQLVTWGMLNLALIFAFKCMLCFKVYENMVPKHAQLAIVIGGCALRICVATFVRVPMYLMFRLYRDMTPENQFSYWYNNVDSAGAVSATIFTLLCRSMIDYWMLPACVNYYVNLYFKQNAVKGSKPIQYLKSSKIGIVVGLWIGIWCFFATIGIFYESTQPILFAVVWGPLLYVSYVIREDKVRAKVAGTLHYSIGYLTLYLWLLDMIPEFCGNILNGFQDLSNEFIRFLASLAYLVSLLFITEISKNVLTFAGKPFYDNTQLLAPIQFIKTFFDLLFFISIRLNDPLFFPILLIQMMALVAENAFGAPAVFHYIVKKLGLNKKTLLSAKVKQTADEQMREEIIEVINERTARKTKVQEVLQKILIDTVAIVLLVVGYYSYISYYRASAGDTQALINSFFYGIKTLNDLNSTVLLNQFALILCVRWVTYCIPVYYLYRKLQEFNTRIVKSDDSKALVVQSSKLLDYKSYNMSNGKEVTATNIPPLNFGTIMLRHLDDGWWIFFLIAFIAGNRVCLMIRNVLLNSNDKVLLEVAVKFFGASSNTALAKVTYWSISLVRRVLIG